MLSLLFKLLAFQYPNLMVEWGGRQSDLLEEGVEEEVGLEAAGSGVITRVLWLFNWCELSRAWLVNS